MQLQVSTKSGVPLYVQIIEQIKYLVASGRLVPGQELPPIRTLAEQLLVNPNTVARAYRDLEHEGILFSRRGAGTYVAESGTPLANKERRRLLAERADRLLTEAHQLDFSVDDVVEVLRERGKHFDMPSSKRRK